VDLETQSRTYWDARAPTLDAAIRRDLATPALRAAWPKTLERLLPPAPASVLDAGTGTGFLALIAARLGHRVTALDSSAGMLAVLREKASALGVEIDVVQADAAEPSPGPFDVVMERNVLWTLPDAKPVLDAWRAVAHPGGSLLAFEGAWGPDGGVGATVRRHIRERPKRWRGPAAPRYDPAPFPDQVRATLPHAKGMSPEQALTLVAASAWGPPRVQRLRRVEWSERRAGGPVNWIFGVAPRYVVVAPA
jgi:SAM-dependent methyltransferase